MIHWGRKMEFDNKMGIQEASRGERPVKLFKTINAETISDFTFEDAMALVEGELVTA